MQRGSDRLSVHRDDEMKHELQGLLRSGHPTRVEEWHDPEPSAEDDPEIWGGPVVPGSPRATLETIRLELARNLGRSSFPADASALAGGLSRKNAPDGLVEAVRELPGKDRYATVQELAEALVGSGR
ncbi:DUF2795 domain-containing protein [Streptomyces sp. NBC_00637]|uniref:DUF2795 domain-containing protein n=1 Tax=Streptomyces sp. NBC_00637 TaxID=2903667 RepID=UPI003251905B